MNHPRGRHTHRCTCGCTHSRRQGSCTCRGTQGSCTCRCTCGVHAAAHKGSCTRRGTRGVHAATHKAAACAAAHTPITGGAHTCISLPFLTCPPPSHRASGHSSLCSLCDHPEERAGPQPGWFQRLSSPYLVGGKDGPGTVVQRLSQ